MGKIKTIEIGKGKAVMVCGDCGKIMGVYSNAKEDQTILVDCFCLECHNRSCESSQMEV